MGFYQKTVMWSDFFFKLYVYFQTIFFWLFQLCCSPMPLEDMIFYD